MAAYTERVSWWKYVERIAQTQSGNQIAKDIGGNVAASTVNSWKKGADPSPANVKAFAAAYHRPEREAILAAYLGEGAGASDLTDEELVAELLKRLKR